MHPDNVVFWRLAALEEAMKYNSVRLTEHDKELARHEREFVNRAELRVTAVDQREVWTLRIVAAGVLLSNLIAIAALFVPHTG